MILEQLLRQKPAKAAGRRLYGPVASQSRTKVLFSDLGAPDTPEGRFEVLTLHIFLVIDRLRAVPGAEETSQALFDTFLRELDSALRELGVGDLSVGKKMRKLGEAFYGRAKAYDAAFRALPDRAELEAAISRLILAGAEGDAPTIAAYAIAQRDALARQGDADLLSGEIAFAAAKP